MTDPVRAEQEKARLIAQLAGCSKVIRSNRTTLKMLVAALLGCEDHGGTHNLFVVEDGEALCVSVRGYNCLKEMGVKLL